MDCSSACATFTGTRTERVFFCDEQPATTRAIERRTTAPGAREGRGEKPARRRQTFVAIRPPLQPSEPVRWPRSGRPEARTWNGLTFKGLPALARGDVEGERNRAADGTRGGLDRGGDPEHHLVAAIGLSGESERQLEHAPPPFVEGAHHVERHPQR